MRQEKVGRLGPAPAQPVLTQPPGGHHTVNVWMELELAAPGVEHAQNAQLGAQVFNAAGYILQRARAFFEQQRVPKLLVRAQPGAQAFGHGEGDEVIGKRQQLEFLTRDPIAGVSMAALRAGPVIAGVIDKMIRAAVGAAINFSSQRPGSASQDGLDSPAMGGKELRAKLPFILRPMPAQNLGQ